MPWYGSPARWGRGVPAQLASLDSWKACFPFSQALVICLQAETCLSDHRGLCTDVAPHPGAGFVRRKKSLFWEPLASVEGRSWAWEPRLWSSKPQEEWGQQGYTDMLSVTSRRKLKVFKVTSGKDSVLFRAVCEKPRQTVYVIHQVQSCCHNVSTNSH